MSSIDDIWASMNEGSGVKKSTAAPAVKKTKKMKDKSADSKEKAVAPATKETLDYAAMTTKIARDVQAFDENELGVRKKALASFHSILFVDFDMSEDHYNEVFRDVCKKVFKRFADPSEKCRELAQKITLAFFQRCTDIVPTLGYYFPALMKRVPAGFGYDEEMKIFVADMEEHDAYRRGRAVDRQDRSGTVGTITHSVVEPSEEIRYLTCNTLYGLIQRVCAIGACPVLHPYFQEIIMFLQTQLRDPHPEVKVVACNALELLARTDEYEQGMKFFSVGLVRAILPVLRHRLTKVRVAGIAAMHYCMVVPDRAKRKAAGSEAITDLVGFREDNVLPIAAFYKSEVQINHLAELVIDKSLPVREELAKFLYVLLTEIGDRYDHHTRLLPYVLDLLTDETPSVSSVALATLQKCGKEYESEHEDEIRDRRQYGVDGDDRINLDKPLPAPFLERPRIGMRLYIRGLSKRFLNALVAELTNWVSTTRLKSAQLLKMLVVLCEEHLTMEAHTLFPSFIKAMRFAHDDKDTVLYTTLQELFELLGRYIQPEVYIYYILPRLRGDADVVAFGVDTPTRVVAMDFLQALLTGSKPSMIVPHLDELVTTLTDPFVVPFDSPTLQSAATAELLTVFQAIKGKGTKVIEAHYLATGRLSSLRSTVRTAFRFLLLQLSVPALAGKAWEAMHALAELEADHGLGVAYLYKQHGAALATAALADYEVDAQWAPLACPEHLLLCRLLQPPASAGLPVQRDAAVMAKLLDFFCSVHTGVSLSVEVENTLLLALSELLISTLLSLTAHHPHDPSLAETDAAVRTRVEALLEAYVFDMRWTRTPTLLAQSQRVLAILTDAPVDMPVKVDHLSKLFAGVGITGSATKDDAGWEEDTPSSAYLSGGALQRSADCVFETTLRAALTSTVPVAQRRDGLTIVDRVLFMLREHAGRSKLKSFAFYEKTDAAGAGDALLEGYLRVLACKVATQRVFAHLLGGLDDSDDNVRNTCLETIITAVPLLLSDSEIRRLQGDERLAQTVCTLANVQITRDRALISMDFAQLVSALLKQVTLPRLGEGDGDFLAMLNDALRVVCVLDASQFESIVRAELVPLMSSPAAVEGEGEGEAGKGRVGLVMQGAELNDFVSGLLNHVDVLLQFQ